MKLFHYTPVFRAVMILRTGVIRRSTGRTPPYVWLSSNPTDEPTANRVPLSPEEFRQCDAHALIALERMARFVFDGWDATPWADLPLSSEARRKLKRLAKPKGGRPEDWSALSNDVPCGDLPLEIETFEGWRMVEQAELERRYEDLNVTLDDDGRVVKFFQTRRRP